MKKIQGLQAPHGATSSLPLLNARVVILRIREGTSLVDQFKWSVMQSYPARALDRKLQVDWAKDAREGPRVLVSLRVDFGPMG